MSEFTRVSLHYIICMAIVPKYLHQQKGPSMWKKLKKYLRLEEAAALSYDDCDVAAAAAEAEANCTHGRRSTNGKKAITLVNFCGVKGFESGLVSSAKKTSINWMDLLSSSQFRNFMRRYIRFACSPRKRIIKKKKACSFALHVRRGRGHGHLLYYYYYYRAFILNILHGTMLFNKKKSTY